jgi:hypothetical protein
VADTGPRRHEDTKAPDGESPLPEGEGQGEGTPPTEVSGEGRPRCCLLDPGREAPRASHSLRLVMLRVAGAALRAVSPTRPSRRPERPRVLLIRPDHLGDTLLTTPAVELLRKALPDARLTMLVGPWSEEMARRDPLLDEVLVLPFPGFTRAPKGSYLAPYRLLRQAASELRRGSYDAALVLRFDHWWGAWLAALAGIPTRVGYGVRECVPFLTDAQPPPDRLHWTAQSLALVDALPRIWEGGRTDAGVPTEPAVRPGVPALRFPTGEKDARRAGSRMRRLMPGPSRDGRILGRWRRCSVAPRWWWAWTAARCTSLSRWAPGRSICSAPTILRCTAPGGIRPGIG